MYLGHNKDGKLLRLDANDLLTHGVVLGRTGSGKTGLTIALLEEIASSGASAIVFDPKGDLTNLALSLCSKEEFARWVEPGVDPEEAYLRHGEGLAAFGLGFEHVAWWKSVIDVSIYAPGKVVGGGKAVNVFPTLALPRKDDAMPARVRAARDVGAILQAVNQSDGPYDPALVFMTEAVLTAWRAGYALPVDAWPGVLTKPFETLKTFGGMKLEDFYPKRARTKLARTLIGFRHQADRWLSGERLDISRFCSTPKPQLAVFTMRHLNEEDRLFFTSIMMHRLVDFMFETDASQKLKLLVVLDEARGYLPPHPYNPPTKQPICTLLAQGRAQGLGMLIGTQNPMDLDYKALSNVGTWFVGRLRERDCARDLIGELRNRGVNVEDIQELPQRRFMLLDKRGKHQELNVRWCMNYLRGPLGANELLRLDDLETKIKVKPKKKSFLGRFFS